MGGGGGEKRRESLRACCPSGPEAKSFNTLLSRTRHALAHVLSTELWGQTPLSTPVARCPM